MPKNNMTPRTPEIDMVLLRWHTFANQNDILVAPSQFISDIAFKAKVNIDYCGACICKPRERLVCPCPQCLPEVKSQGACFCHIFISHDFAIKHGWE